uniref:DZANK-type domain-containing protein n=1 Tax=Cyanothece sp. (strain PCC 7425 / ATCC 29141) TaxID=395961 RepID=B8HWM8_CYAP4
MFTRFKRFIQNLIRKSTHVRHEPLNKVSIVILILIDIFVLINVFNGLNSVAAWPLAPQEEFPCYQSYAAYHKDSAKDREFRTIEALLQPYAVDKIPVNSEKRLGQVSSRCDRLIALRAGVKNPQTLALKKQIDSIRNRISKRNADIATYQKQYDSTLLEKLAGQDPSKSINQTTADRAKADIANARSQIQQLQAQLAENVQALITEPGAAAYLNEISQVNSYQTLKQAYESAAFWHPNQQFLLQTLFLLPLIAFTYLWHSNAVNKGRGTQSLLSWHLLLIFCIPLLFKVLEFIQFGTLAEAILKFLIQILGGLVFISSYLLIVIIPLLGFGLIKFLQRFIFNPQVQAKGRIRKSLCIQCGKKCRSTDEFCPFCGYEQFRACHHCHRKTYKYTEFCHLCGGNLADPVRE